jgi:lipopolysaccharide/colanic/teichoic acid biosynthesis glycosyltransferase
MIHAAGIIKKYVILKQNCMGKSAVKFIFDRVFGFLALVMLSPLFLLIVLTLKMTTPGPVFFRQQRIGKGGRLFTMIKFRTMVANDGTNTVTAGNDPRITRTGAWLRRWKLDELPELVNVLAGDMSFVGPRPDVPGYADRLTGDQRRVLLLRPGITGPATLKYLREEEILAGVENPREYNDLVIFPDKVRINLEYQQKFTFLGDLKILLYTILRKECNEY